jgi:LysM repeat protein
VTYIVQAGDTIASISSAFGITTNQLMYANCLTSTAISPGQTLWVPPTSPNPANAILPVASDTPPPTAVPPTDTPPPAPTNTAPLPTATLLPPTTQPPP